MKLVKMCRFYSKEMVTLTLSIAFVFAIVHVECFKYKFAFDPSKFLLPCKDTDYKSVHDFFDFSNLNLTIGTNNVLNMKGYVLLVFNATKSPLVVRNFNYY